MNDPEEFIKLKGGFMLPLADEIYFRIGDKLIAVYEPCATLKICSMLLIFCSCFCGIRIRKMDFNMSISGDSLSYSACSRATSNS